MGESAVHIHLLNKPDRRQSFINAVCKLAETCGFKNPQLVSDASSDFISREAIIFYNPLDRWSCVYHNIFPSSDKQLMQELARDADTLAVDTMLFDGDVLDLTVADNAGTYEFSTEMFYDCDEDDEDNGDLPEHIWEALLAPGHTLSEVKDSLDRLECRITDLQGELSRLFGFHEQLSWHDYDHLDHLLQDNDSLSGYELIRIRFDNSETDARINRELSAILKNMPPHPGIPNLWKKD